MKKALRLMFVLFVPFLVTAQVTTSSISGTIKNAAGAGLEGASVTAVHVPSGTQYVAMSRKGGTFAISNMRVGGPYRIDISYVGYEPQTLDSIYLELGVDTKLTLVLQSTSQTLAEVVVSANRNVGRSTQGTATQITQLQLQTLPTITRNIDDYTRLTPQAQVRRSNSDGSTLGVSFAGQSNRYNRFTIDGANATDVFGLAASGTNGGQAALNPIPFDAIDQVQVVLSPYDVTLSGFTGGGINAVTKSGSNQFHGSLYGYNQNQNLVGKSPTDRSKYGDFKDNIYGVRLGGPIIKNKLFFFINYEGETRSQPIDNMPGSANSKIRTSTLDSLADFLKDESKHPGWSYNPGAYNGFNKDKKSDAFFARIDWNINNKNKLTLRHNYVKGNNFVFSDGTSSMSFYNNGYNFYSTTNSTVAELNSNFSNKFANMLRLTYTAARDKRGTPGELFPSVAITDNGATYNFGTEYSSQANSLDQNTFTITDNFNIYAGKHNITLGTDNTIYNSKNVFLQGLVGGYTYGSLQSFYDDASGVDTAYATNYRTVYSTDPKNPKPIANVHFTQLAFYAQDAYSIRSNFKLTYGVRMDIPIFTSKPAVNEAFNSSNIAKNNDVATNKIPTTKLLLSPRVGFNWDVHGDRRTQIRGGAGLFTGRIPFVWVSNQYTNTGIGTISSNLFGADIAGNNIHFDPNNPYQPSVGSGPGINVTDPDFKYPRTLRANLALDQRLPFGFTGTIEGLYTKTLQDILYQDLNLAPSATDLILGNSTRPFYGKKVDSLYSNVYSLGNTNKGYSYNITVSLSKSTRNGWSGSLAYSLGHSYTMNDGTSSTAASQYRFVYAVNGSNNVELARSNYDQGSRIVGYIGKKFTYGKCYTNIGLVYSGQSGQPFSYVYFGDLNGDDGSVLTKPSTSGGNDLIYMPTDASQFADHGGLTAADQFAAFQQYINSDAYMRSHTGENTKRNGDRLPWENHFDLKVEQAFAFYKTHTISVVANIFNVGNLISKNWGKSYYVSNQEVQPLNVDHFELQADGSVKPYYYFNPTFGLNQYTHRPWQYADYLSRWSMQLGVRYSF
ncbi:TonB-dependent receptor [Ilyomonas limi]|uniref:TonB-dependent receptor n=1 Tax=Ilyomonas limi TaxID=2575867 RepID=A0A4U3KZ78_9BACT|nr:TonB-dependent receptor [Ilyomonas limi]TKK67742.1 TonB-dependent receptor [Ilyomonas limi]